MRNDGADIPQAINHLREAGYTVRSLAADLAVSTSTVYRWSAGRNIPSPANMQALKDLVTAAYARHVHRRTWTTHLTALDAAAEALLSDADRAERDRFEAKMRQRDRVARVEVVQAPEAQEPRQSAYAAVDPFALVASGQSREVAMF